MPKDSLSVTPDMTLEAILEDVPGALEILVKHFGAGASLPGQTWMSEPLAKACAIRGVDEGALLKDLRALAR